HKHISTLPLDYRHTEATQRTLVAATVNGLFERTICWTHDEQSTDASDLFAAVTRSTFYQLLGSAVADPADPERLQKRRQAFATKFPLLDYHTIVLGFQRTPGGPSRWLSHEEISNGTYRALSAPGQHHVIGIVRPWTARP
ncbi:MAG: hypothetical protein ABI414_09080, partial [Devosia sp.]